MSLSPASKPASKKRAWKLDDVSRRGEAIVDPADVESSASAAELPDLSSFETSSSEEQELEPEPLPVTQEPLEQRAERIQAQLEADDKAPVLKTPIDHMLRGLFAFIKVLVINHYWPDKCSIDMDLDDTLTDDEFYYRLAYARWLPEVLDWEQAMKNAVNVAIHMHVAQVEARIGPVADHPQYDIVELFQKYRRIFVKRTQKRQQAMSLDGVPNAERFAMQQEWVNGIFIDAWECKERDMKEIQRHSEPVVDERGRPVTYVKNGKEKILTNRRQNAILGHHQDKVKAFMVIPLHSDKDPDAIDHWEDLQENERLLQMAEESNGNFAPFEAGLEPACQFLVPAGGPTLQLKVLHNFVHFIAHVKQAVQGALDRHQTTTSSLSALWSELVGPKNATLTSTAKFTQAKRTLLGPVVVCFREILLTRLRMMQCEGCRKMPVIDCFSCPQCGITIRHCQAEASCKASAVAAHAKAHHPAEAPKSTLAPVKKKQKVVAASGK